MGKVHLFRLAFRWLPRLPRPLVRASAMLAAWLIWACAGATRRRVRANLAHLPTLAANPAELDRVTRRIFRSLLLNYVDLFVPPPPGLLKTITISNLDAFRAVQAEGHGAILMGLHTSSFEWGKYGLRELAGRPVVAPVEVLRPPELFDLVLRERRKSGIHFLPISEGATLREMIAALRRGDNVLMAIDRDVVQTGVIMPFFGAPARIPTGPIALARQTGAPLVLLNLWRDAYGRLTGSVTPLPHDLVGPATRGDEALRRALQPLVAALEREILAHPDQWLAAFADDIWLTEDATATAGGEGDPDRTAG
jgi:lauroyl/myristoyl acyltransferase